MTIKQLTILCLGFLLFINCDRDEKRLKPDINWKYQVDSLLMPFWMTSEAFGQPVGNFPTYRSSEGLVMDKTKINFNKLSEIENFLFVGGTDSLQRDFLRMKSRQTYAYGVAYHLTGNEAYLKLAKLGTEYLLENGEYTHGAPVSFWKGGIGMPEKKQRNAQDLAYSLTGPTFYYYLTRDEEVLNAILKVKEYIFKEYYKPMPQDESTNHFIWVKKDFEYDTKNRIELVAQLDQLNAYMLMITPLLSNDKKERFKEEMKEICYLLKDKFYNQNFNVFRGDLNAELFEAGHSDFGHTIKTFWMLYQIGQLVEDHELTAFAKQKGSELLAAAYVHKNEAWSWRYEDDTLKRNEGNIWWIFAELDQMAATLSFRDTTMYSTYLKQTYKYWDKHFIDKENKETWMALYDDGKVVSKFGKAGMYKNAYHSLEHALIGYFSTANYYNTDITLYFAFEKGVDMTNHEVNPYYYSAEITGSKEFDFTDESLGEFQGREVVFKNIK